MILYSIRGKQQFQWSDRKVSTKSPKLLKIPYNKNMNTTNTKTEYQTFRNFLTDEQWDLIDMALNEFQDHEEYADQVDTLGARLQDVFDNSVDQTVVITLPEGTNLKRVTTKEGN